MQDEMKKKQIDDLNKQIRELQDKKRKINPYSCLKDLSAKKFGEAWSEFHILEQCPNLDRVNSKGYDFYHKNLGRIELKSFRIPAKKGCVANQCHPKECDYFLFAFYDCENYEDYLYLISSYNLIQEFSRSPQHDRNLIPTCFTINFKTKENSAKLQKYQLSYKELNKLL